MSGKARPFRRSLETVASKSLGRFRRGCLGNAYRGRRFALPTAKFGCPLRGPNPKSKTKIQNGARPRKEAHGKAEPYSHSTARPLLLSYNQLQSKIPSMSRPCKHTPKILALLLLFTSLSFSQNRPTQRSDAEERERRHQIEAE